ncbi:MAG: glycosyltransferase family 4 protein [Ruegeria sp.]
MSDTTHNHSSETPEPDPIGDYGNTSVSTPRPKVAVIASLTASLANFRLDFLRELSHRAEVLALAPDSHPETEALLAELGITFHQIPMTRTGVNPFQDLATLRALYSELSQFEPDIVFPYTMKPIIYGCLAARLAGVERRIPMCTGLGYVFEHENPGFSRRVLRSISVWLYRIALKGAEEVLVYNRADEAEFIKKRLCSSPTRLTIVPGSGINLDRFAVSAPPGGAPVFLMIARLLRSKGVFDYVQAARLVRETYPEARFQLLGPIDANPDSVTHEQLQEWTNEGIVEYLGETSDVRPYLSDCSVFVLPTRYREGIPRTILEAMSTGRAVVTTDAPGCAETVEEGETGFVVPVGDAQALANAMGHFTKDPNLAARMGPAARHRAETRFDVNRINELLLAKLGLLTKGETLSPPPSDSV